MRDEYHINAIVDDLVQDVEDRCYLQLAREVKRARNKVFRPRRGN